MEVYLQVRRAHFDEGRSKRSIARDFGLARGTVGKMCAFPMPSGYRRSRDVRRPKLEGFTGTIDQWLLEDLERPKKQRHTVKRIFERLRDEDGFTGGYTTVKDYVRVHRQKALEARVAEDGIILTEAQVQALEKKNRDDEARGEVETAHPGYLGSQDTFYVGTLKGVGRIYQQSYVDPYSKVAQAKLYTTKTPITAADLLNDRVLPFHDEHDLPVLRIMTDRGTEYCGRADKHDYQLFLAINDIDHTKTKVKSPQTNGIRERFHKTVLQEFYQVAFRKRLYDSVDALQDDLDQWLHHYNTERTHQGKMCCGRTPFQTMIEGKEIWKEKFVN